MVAVTQTVPNVVAVTQTVPYVVAVRQTVSNVVANITKHVTVSQPQEDYKQGCFLVVARKTLPQKVLFSCHHTHIAKQCHLGSNIHT